MKAKARKKKVKTRIDAHDLWAQRTTNDRLKRMSKRPGSNRKTG